MGLQCQSSTGKLSKNHAQRARALASERSLTLADHEFGGQARPARAAPTRRMPDLQVLLQQRNLKRLTARGILLVVAATDSATPSQESLEVSLSPAPGPGPPAGLPAAAAAARAAGGGGDSAESLPVPLRQWHWLHQ